MKPAVYLVLGHGMAPGAGAGHDADYGQLLGDHHHVQGCVEGGVVCRADELQLRGV